MTDLCTRITLFITIFMFGSLSLAQKSESEIDFLYNLSKSGENEFVKSVFEFKEVVEHIENTPMERLKQEGAEKLFQIAFPDKDIPAVISKYSFNMVEFDYLNLEFVGIKDQKVFADKIIHSLNLESQSSDLITTMVFADDKQKAVEKYSEEQLYEMASKDENGFANVMLKSKKVIDFLDNATPEQLAEAGVDGLFKVAFPNRGVPSNVQYYDFDNIDFAKMDLDEISTIMSDEQNVVMNFGKTIGLKPDDTKFFHDVLSNNAEGYFNGDNSYFIDKAQNFATEWAVNMVQKWEQEAIEKEKIWNAKVKLSESYYDDYFKLRDKVHQQQDKYFTKFIAYYNKIKWSSFTNSAGVITHNGNPKVNLKKTNIEIKVIKKALNQLKMYDVMTASQRIQLYFLEKGILAELKEGTSTYGLMRDVVTSTNDGEKAFRNVIKNDYLSSKFYYKDLISNLKLMVSVYELSHGNKISGVENFRNAIKILKIDPIFNYENESEQEHIERGRLRRYSRDTFAIQYGYKYEVFWYLDNEDPYLSWEHFSQYDDLRLRLLYNCFTLLSIEDVGNDDYLFKNSKLLSPVYIRKKSNDKFDNIFAYFSLSKSIDLIRSENYVQANSELDKISIYLDRLVTKIIKNSNITKDDKKKFKAVRNIINSDQTEWPQSGAEALRFFASDYYGFGLWKAIIYLEKAEINRKQGLPFNIEFQKANDLFFKVTGSGAKCSTHSLLSQEFVRMYLSFIEDESIALEYQDNIGLLLKAYRNASSDLKLELLDKSEKDVNTKVTILAKWVYSEPNNKTYITALKKVSNESKYSDLSNYLKGYTTSSTADAMNNKWELKSKLYTILTHDTLISDPRFIGTWEYVSKELKHNVSYTPFNYLFDKAIDSKNSKKIAMMYSIQGNAIKIIINLDGIEYITYCKFEFISENQFSLTYYKDEQLSEELANFGSILHTKISDDY